MNKIHSESQLLESHGIQHDSSDLRDSSDSHNPKRREFMGNTAKLAGAAIITSALPLMASGTLNDSQEGEPMKITKTKKRR